MESTETDLEQSEMRRYAFLILTLATLVIAGGHLYLLGGLSEIRLGLPTWLWIQLGVIGVLLVLAWVAIGLVPEPNSERGGEQE
jgi:hypothetical protein